MIAQHHLLDTVWEFIREARGETPFLLTCICFAAICAAVILITVGFQMDARDQDAAEASGE